jgi:CO/xanthine dehydrogenase FAD-binding subunit
MITEYHRPQTIEEALALLTRSQPFSVALAGGTALDRQSSQPLAVVDLQALGLDQIAKRGNILEIGAMVRLQTLLDSAMPEAFKQVIQHEATYNLRQSATVAGTLVAADGRSPFTTALLALDAQLTALPGPEQISLGDLLPLRAERLRGRLITLVSIPLNARLAYESVGRTPADLPIVCAAAGVWPSGRTRLALGGFGHAPTLAFDGNSPEGAEVAACSAYALAGDEWASAEYREAMAGVLAQRCIDRLWRKNDPT